MSLLKFKIYRKVSKFWFFYFLERIFYLFFAVFVYNKISKLGDTERYLSSSIEPGFSSTSFMDIMGAISGTLFLHIEVLANLPFTILSFLCVKWAVERLELDKYINKYLLFILISFPNFMIWTSVITKETFGLVFSCLLGITFVNFLKGRYKFGWTGWIGSGLCLLFKPQYYPFILGGLIYIYLCRKIIKKPLNQLAFAFFTMLIIFLFLFLLSDLINQISQIMYLHFAGGNSNRENPFVNDGDFFRLAPYGMFISFFGPEFNEMLKSPLMLIAGLEGLFIVATSLILSSKVYSKLLYEGKISMVPFFSILLTTFGIMFIHYPFGIFNAGSAIRYRTNFLFFFFILFSYLYIYYSNLPSPKKYNYT